VIPILTADEMREADRRTIEEVGLPGCVLMENAGAAVARLVRERFPEGPAVVVAGKGNNGGDGFVVARRLGPRAVVLLVARRSALSGDAALHLGALERSGGRVLEVVEDGEWDGAEESMRRAGVVVDALLGTGLRRRPEGAAARGIAALAAVARAGVPVVAVDLPSGIVSDGGLLDWEAVPASVTVTFGAPKRGHVLPPGCDRVGELVVADIGIPEAFLAGASMTLTEAGDVLEAFPPRSADAHKGTAGRLLIVAGSIGKTGAAILAGTAALRCGSGLVTVATPAPAQGLVAQGRPELMTEPLPVEPDGSLGGAALRRCLALAEERDAVVVGPGLGLAGETPGFVAALAAACPRPLLVDADGLTSLKEHVAATAERSRPTLLTPHPGEAGRMLGLSARDVQSRRVETASRLARERNAVVVLKARRTLVARPDGRIAVNPTGNPGLATGGSGDVLSGILGALLARGLDPWLAGSAGVYLHGAVGDRVAALRGQEGILAEDLCDALPEALAALRGSASA
jgi:NAD(P)H-hydrate epimerase